MEGVECGAAEGKNFIEEKKTRNVVMTSQEMWTLWSHLQKIILSNSCDRIYEECFLKDDFKAVFILEIPFKIHHSKQFSF